MPAPPSKSERFESRLPPRLSWRLRTLLNEPNFNLLLEEGSGRVTFEYVVNRLKELSPWLDGEQAALVAHVSQFVTRQLEAGHPSNLPGLETTFDVLQIDDLPLDSALMARIERWLTQFPLEQLKGATEEFTLRGDRNGQYFESAFHNDFIPNRIPDGLERAKLIFAHRYLSHHNDFVREHGIEPEALAPLLRARGTLELFAGGPIRRKPGKRRLPATVRELLKLLE